MLATVGDVDVVEARRERNVLHAAAAVFVVFARHLGLRRTLHGDAEAADSCTPVGRNDGMTVENRSSKDAVLWFMTGGKVLQSHDSIQISGATIKKFTCFFNLKIMISALNHQCSKDSHDLLDIY